MKTLITLSLTAIAASASAAVTASDCVSPVSLEYQVTSQGNTKEIAIHRAGREVVREDLTTGVVEYWYHSPAGRLKLIRYVDSEKHGIEYQAEDFRGNEDRVWQEISLAVPADVRDSMTLVSKQGSGCELVETWESEAQKGKLVWLPAQQIVVSYENPALAWSLTEQGDSRLQQRLASRDDYTLIDFADIGDSEENPFVKKMINWGFVEHGASGFYDEHGHAIEGHGHAH